MRTFRNLCLLCACCLNVMPAYATGLDHCANLNSRYDAYNLEQLLEESDYVGVYTVLSQTPFRDEGVRGDPSLFTGVDYEMILSANLKGESPMILRIRGQAGIADPFVEYFGVPNLHDKVRKNKLIYVKSFYFRKWDGENCSLRPVFYKGFEYLIFSAETPFSYEPITSQLADGWFLLVVSELGFDVPP